mgnify:CR=1 FL=1
MQWEAVIGLEVHAQLQTATKIFSSQSAAFGAEPNHHVNEVCAGMPGVLPVLNGHAVELAVMAGLALGCEVHPWSQFARKNYFYPDLPKGYQISQYKHPICTGGHVAFRVGDEEMRCELTRIHMEEDAGKNIHRGRHSLVDLNRAGVPLIEIVSEPQLSTAEQAAAYLKELRNVLRYIGVCDGNMEQGSFRCDANVSVRPVGQKTLGTRAEIKNLNSFRFVQRAIDYEIARQIDLIEDGHEVVQETRLFNVDSGRTFSMRSKEDAHDYRYFPDPDLPPLIIEAQRIEQMRQDLPELPADKRARYQKDLGLSLYDAEVLTQSRAVAEFFEAALAIGGSVKGVANWTMNEVLREAQHPDDNLGDLKFDAAQLGALVKMVDDGEVTGKIAKKIFAAMVKDGGDPVAIADAQGLRPLRDEGKLRAFIQEALDANPGQAQALRSGKMALLGFFMGQVMKKTRGKADPKMTQRLIQEMVKE